MTKGDETKNAILDTALAMASELGLEGVTIGILAKATKMSKSGLFAHFQSKENLQVEILKYGASIFIETAVMPALQTEAGIPRIRALVNNWVKWASSRAGGCLFVTASNEFSNREGIVRTFLLQQQKVWVGILRKVARSAIKTGEFRQDIDCDQFVFELYSLLLGFHLYHHLLHSEEIDTRKSVALDHLFDKYRKFDS
ncbi:MAG: TetR/AcrR family transcriptional regulator [Deltaproteobacteria bacterium]|jgi:AcrR family transcriptional regulator|nr:TetR/AcrR family transcriptional regulator [Deltaproteobacteria bacterium]MCW8893604.1 TetR/AcrR family transcriptional regulator [Deltaproteobacteria bacterium]